MAIGVRILSNNLSGKTATVTFLPVSGGTLDLGSKTIPFNNITPFPYGVYNLYFAEYDYTYTIEIPITGVFEQTVSVVSTITGSTNWQSVSLNYGDLTAQIINLNIDTTEWSSFYSVYPTNEKGYMFIFQNPSNEYLVSFTDSICDIKYQYTGSTNSSFYAVRGLYNLFIDGDNGKLVYTDGVQYPIEFTWDSVEYPSWNVNSDFDICSRNGNFLFTIENSTNDNTQTYLMTATGGTLFNEYDSTNIDKWYGSYFSGDFFYEAVYDSLSDSFISFNLYDSTTAELLENIILTGGSVYNSYNLTFYGDNKLMILFYNGSDIDIDYLIRHYDGNTNTLIEESHIRTKFYVSNTIQAEQKFYPNDVGSDSVFIVLYDSPNYDNRVGHQLNSCDMIYMLSGESSLTTYTYLESSDPTKWLYVYPYCGNNFMTYCDNGDGYVSSFSITPSGVNINNLILKSDVNYTSQDHFGDVSVIKTETTTPYEIKLFYINSNGEFSDTLIASDQFGFSQNESYGTWWVRIGGVNEHYYINESVTGFTSMPFYDNDYISNSYYEQNNYERPSNYVFFNSGSYESQILTKTNLSDVFTLPAHNGGYNFSVGKDKFMYVYLDASTNLLNINLYDFDYNLLNSISTTHTSWNNIIAVKDRYYVSVNENSTYIYYLISQDNIESVTVSDEYNYNSINDYIWWD